MRRLTCIGFGVLIALSALVPTAAHGDTQDPARTEEKEATPPEDDTDPIVKEVTETSASVTVSQTIVVEGSFEYIPTANMIVPRLPMPLRWVPANIGTVNEPVLREQSALVLGDALRNVSGSHQQTESGVADFFTIRGFDSEAGVLVLFDGAPEPEITFYQMYNVERVEVFKGPGGFLYGRNQGTGALAGIVNIVRRQPQPGSFTSFGASFGSYGTKQGNLDWNLSPSNSDAFSFRLNMLYRDSDFYRRDKENQNLAINPSFAWRLGPDTLLNVNLEYVDLEYQPDSGLPLLNGGIPDVDRRQSYQSPLDFSDQKIGRFQVDFETKLNAAWTLRNKTFHRSLDWESNGTLIIGTTSPSLPPCSPFPATANDEVCRVLTLLDDRQEFVGNRFEAVWSGKTGKVSHDLLIGAEIAEYADKFTRDAPFLPNIEVFDPVEKKQPLFFLPGQNVGSDSRSRVAAPFVINRFTFSERWQALAGARLDFIDFEDDGPSLPRSRRDRELSPLIGVTFAATGALNLYANAGQAFAPPSARLINVPRPEKSRQYEVGVKIGRPGAKAQTTLAAYRIDRENIGIAGNSGFFLQSGDQRSRGFEIDFAAEPLPRLRTFFSYAFNDSELTRFVECVGDAFDPATGQCLSFSVDHSGNTPSFVPKHLASLWVSRRFGSGWGVGAGGRYASSHFIDEDNAFEIEDYVLFDAAIYYTLDRWEFSLNFKNLTNVDYETRGFGPNSVIPATPFSVYGGFEYRF